MIKVNGITESAGAQIQPTKEHFFKNILVATDFSPASQQAVEYAASLARRYGSSVFVTHVITLDGYPLVSPEFAVASFQKRRVEAQQGFRDLLKSGRLTQVPFKTFTQEGNLWPAIEESVKKYEIDLVVVGTHGAGLVKKALIGSGAEEIFRKATVPVLTVGPLTGHEPQFELEFENILFATDFGRSAELEADYAFSLAQEHRARLRLVHVFPHPEAYGIAVLANEKDLSLAQLHELVPSGAELHCKLDFEVATGDPVEQILRIAEDSKADLIVMGAKARKSLAGNVPHTKAYRVVCGAHCPVLTIRS